MSYVAEQDSEGPEVQSTAALIESARWTRRSCIVSGSRPITIAYVVEGLVLSCCCVAWLVLTVSPSDILPTCCSLLCQ